MDKWALGGICVIVTLALIVIPYAPQAEAVVTNCTGILAAGTYDDISITSFCAIRSDATVNGNVMVDSGTFLFLRGATIGGSVELGSSGVMHAFFSTINGNIEAGDNSRIFLRGGNFVGGAIMANNCTLVQMSGLANGETINGNISLDGCDSISIRNRTIGGTLNIAATLSITRVGDSVVGGNIEVTNSDGFYHIFGNSVGVNMEIKNNIITGTFFPNDATVGLNTISGDLQCSGNVPPPMTLIGLNAVSGTKDGQCAGL